MAESGFFARISNLWKGFVSIFVGNLEKENPEAVYEAAIRAHKEKYQKLRGATQGIIIERNKLEDELKASQEELGELDARIATAVEAGDDEAALVYLERQQELEGRIADLEKDFERAGEEAEKAKSAIVAFEKEIEKLKREKDEQMAKIEASEARIHIQESLSSMSFDADMEALNNVRDHAKRLRAKADANSELAEGSLDNRLKKIEQRSTNARAVAKLEALKKARDSTQEQKAGAAAAVAAKKTI